jgi:hypothetical protein
MRTTADLLETLLDRGVRPEEMREFIAALPPNLRRALQRRTVGDLGKYGRYAYDPEGFITDVLHESVWSKQRAICTSVLDNPRTAVPAAFAPGKTHLAARLVLWWGSVWPAGTAKVVTTATTYRTVKNQLWPHIRRVHARHKLPGKTNLVEWQQGRELVAFGFCYDDQTEILTAVGWRRFEDLDGQAVATRSPAGAFEWQKPEAVVNEPYDGPMVRFKGRAHDALVTPNHRMVVRRRPFPGMVDRGVEVQEAGWFVGAGIRANGWQVPASSAWGGADPGSFTLDGTGVPPTDLDPIWAPDQVEAVRRAYEDHPPPDALPIDTLAAAVRKTQVQVTRKAQKLGLSAGLPPRSKSRHRSGHVSMPADAWASFLGLYLSEGWCPPAGAPDRDKVFICQSPGSRHLEAMRGVMERTGLPWVYRSTSQPSGGHFVVSHRNLASWLRNNCYGDRTGGRAWHKRVPPAAMGWTPGLLSTLVDHMMMGDGHVDNGFERYLTTSPGLADDLLEVLQKAGASGSISVINPGPSTLGRHVQYRVNIRRREWHGLPVPSVEAYSGRIHCVTVPNGTIYVRRSGKPMWCGNSAPNTDPESVQGYHEPHLLIVVDEAGGITHEIGGALNGLMTGMHTRMLAIGNPSSDEQDTWFEGVCNSPDWHTIPIAVEDTPNFTGEDAGECLACPPGIPPHPVASHLVDEEWLRVTLAEYGEGHPYVEAKVHARFPRIVANRTIPLGWIDEAAKAEPALGSVVRLGVDIASDGGDELAIARVEGLHGRVVHTESGKSLANSVDVAGIILDHVRDAEVLAKSLGGTGKVRVKVDVIGLGWGPVSTLQRWGEEGLHGAEVVGVNVGERAKEPDKYLNQRAEMWWEMRQLLQPDPARDGLPTATLGIDERTKAQLGDPTHKTSTAGRRQIESKADLRKRGRKSPDRAEAVLLAYYEPPDPDGERKTEILV